MKTIQEQINDISDRLNWIEAQLGTNHNIVADAQNVQYELPDFIPDWKNSLQERPAKTEPDYSHLLPRGYEFCDEGQAEKWVKVELKGSLTQQYVIGFVNTCKPNIDYKPYYRPIRKIKEVVTAEPDQYTIEKHGYGWAIYKGRDLMHHGANLGQIHDDKLAQYIGSIIKDFKDAEPDPYQVDWSQAPEGTVAHAYDEEGQGYWYRVTCEEINFCYEFNYSNFTLPSGLDWKQSLRVNPKLK
jgi:hypothetical protein